MTDTIAAEPVAVFTLKSVTEPFTNGEDGVYLNNQSVIKHINNVSIINTSARQTFTVEQHNAFDDILLELAKLGRSVIRLTDTKEFYDGEAQFNKFANATNETIDSVFKLNDDVGLSLSYGDLSVITAFNALQARFVAHYESIKPIVTYKFVDDDHSTKLTQISKVVGKRRLRNGSGYTIGEKMAAKLWEHARTYWSTSTPDTASEYISGIAASGSGRSVYIHHDRVKIGCQTITRYQVEQGAITLGLISA